MFCRLRVRMDVPGTLLVYENGYVQNALINVHIFSLLLETPPPGGYSLGGRVLVEIFGEGVPPASPNPDPISDQKMLFPTPVFRPGLKNPYPFSDLTRSPLP